MRKLFLSNKTILITGAAGSIGSSIAIALSNLGARLILLDVNRHGLMELRNRLSHPRRPLCIVKEVNLECEKERLGLPEWLEDERIQTLDCLINNAAFVATSNLAGWNVPFEQQSLDTWRRVLELNLTAPFHLCQVFYPHLLRSESPSIINIGSIYGEYGPDWRIYRDTKLANPASYAISKGGVVQLTRWLSTTLAPKIRVNCVSPGGIYRNQDEKFVSNYISRTPLARMGTEEDLIGAIVYLASSYSSYVTGQVIRVDGGWGVW